MIRRFILKNETSKPAIEGVQFSTGVVVLAPEMGKYHPLEPVCHANVDEMLQAACAFGSKDGWTIEWIDGEDSTEDKGLQLTARLEQLTHTLEKMKRPSRSRPKTKPSTSTNVD